MQVLPTDGKAIKGWSDIDEAFTDVVRGLRRSITQLTHVSTETPTPSPPKPQIIATPVQSVREPQEPNKPLLKPFDFETVKLNAQGKIIDRPQVTHVNRFIEDLGGGVQLAMVEIPAGEFLMGSPSSEEGSSENERPQRRIRVPKFYLGQNLVTQAQWQALMGDNLAYFKGDGNLPVDSRKFLPFTVFIDQELQLSTHMDP